jgi:ribosomal-protein-alanine N-acetyltransferase
MNLSLPNGFSITHFQPSDRAALVANLEDGSVQVWTLLIPHPYTFADADQWLAEAVPGDADEEAKTNWGIRDESGRQIGGIGFVPGSAKSRHAAEIGYWLAKPWWGRGIMTAAVTALCDHAFQQLGISRITAGVFVGNAGSARVLEKAGFVLEAPLLRKCYRKDGRFIDAMLYAKVLDA